MALRLRDGFFRGLNRVCRNLPDGHGFFHRPRTAQALDDQALSEVSDIDGPDDFHQHDLNDLFLHIDRHVSGQHGGRFAPSHLTFPCNNHDIHIPVHNNSGAAPGSVPSRYTLG